MDKTYNPKIVEDKWYAYWEENGFFMPRLMRQRNLFAL